jgi:two-component system chemotaxis response regulator CheY
MAKTIFCVDDSATIRMLVRKSLEGRGYTIREAEHGKDALARLDEDPSADLFIVDVNMPEMDGFELVKHLKSRTEFSAKPIVFLTTEAGADKKAAGKDLGVNGWIVKPFEEPALIKIVEMLTA